MGIRQGSHATVARRQIAAAGRLRVHALGPRSGGNGAAASRPLAILLRPPRPPARRPRAAPAHRRPAARASSCSAPPRPLGRTSASLGSVVGLNRRVSRAQPPTSRIFLQQPVQWESTRERSTRVSEGGVEVARAVPASGKSTADGSRFEPRREARSQSPCSFRTLRAARHDVQAPPRACGTFVSRRDPPNRARGLKD